MLTLSNILCAVDFSKSSRVALEAAADLAKRFGAKLTLLHVREPPLPLDEAVLSAPEPFEAGRGELESKLEGWRAAAEKLAGREVAADLVYGAAAIEVVTAARTGRHDLVVTGTHSRQGLRRVLLGSVAEQVVREAACPVLVVRQAAEPGD